MYEDATEHLKERISYLEEKKEKLQKIISSLNLKEEDILSYFYDRKEEKTHYYNFIMMAIISLIGVGTCGLSLVYYGISSGYLAFTLAVAMGTCVGTYYFYRKDKEQKKFLKKNYPGYDSFSNDELCSELSDVRCKREEYQKKYKLINDEISTTHNYVHCLNNLSCCEDDLFYLASDVNEYQTLREKKEFCETALENYLKEIDPYYISDSNNDLEIGKKYVKLRKNLY